MIALSPGVAGASTSTQLAELQTSARGWHGVQLAVLGFIGLCGALKDSGVTDDPAWLQQLTAVLVVFSLAFACVGIILVAGAAWPVYGWARAPVSAEEELHSTGKRLRAGIVLTFLAVVAVAVAASSSWWPSRLGNGDLVELSTAGGTVCGTLLDSGEGTIAVEASGQRFVVPAHEVENLRPTGDCRSS